MTRTSNMKGFTLIELMVSVAIFSVVMTTALGSLLAISNADRKAETLKTVMDNMSFALEGMSRSVRTGVNYHCTQSGVLTSPSPDSDCSTTASSYLTFLAVDGSQMTYSLDSVASHCGQTGTGGCIMRRVVGAGGASDSGTLQITAPEIVVTNLWFYVQGAQRVSDGDTKQPRVNMMLNGYVNIGASASSTFNLQSTMTQRIYDQ
jgi:prepilin-type N-terminal cleavage/methylation domain-containing protein